MRAGGQAAWACENLGEDFVTASWKGVAALAQLGVRGRRAGDSPAPQGLCIHPLPLPPLVLVSRGPKPHSSRCPQREGLSGSAPFVRAKHTRKAKGVSTLGTLAAPAPVTKSKGRAHRAQEGREANRTAHASDPCMNHNTCSSAGTCVRI